MAPLNADEHLQARSSIAFQYAGSITLTGPHYSCNAIWCDSQFKSTVAMFESVEVVSAVVMLSVAPLDTGFVQLCFVPYDTNDSGATSVTATAMSSSLHYTQSFVSKDQPINLTVTLPPDHNFGHELKGVTLGNPPPVLAWRIQDIPEAHAKEVTGRLHYKYSLVAHGRTPPAQSIR